MYSDCCKELFAIYITLSETFHGKSNLKTLYDETTTRYNINGDVYKHAFNVLKGVGLIKIETSYPASVSTREDEFIKFVRLNSKETGTYFQTICHDFFALYQRSEVTHIHLHDLLAIFEKSKSKLFCKNLKCRKYIIPNTFSKDYCFECYKEMTTKDCPECVKKGHYPIDKIWGRQKMCKDCKEDKSETLQLILNPEIMKDCEFCHKSFKTTTKRSHICPECLKKHGRNSKLCPVCKKEVIYYSQDKCAYCSAEQQGVKVNRQTQKAVKVCTQCHSNFELDCTKKGWAMTKKCPECQAKTIQYKPKEKKLCPECNQIQLKGRQKICKNCKRNTQKKIQAAKMKICDVCHKQFKVIGKEQICPTCKPDSTHIKCPTCNHVNSYWGYKKSGCLNCDAKSKGIRIEGEFAIKKCMDCGEEYKVRCKGVWWNSGKCEKCKTKPTRHYEKSKDSTGSTLEIKDVLQAIVTELKELNQNIKALKHIK